jgi:diguanylate cyclase (GGDEF)-like protein/PAS domain S-box-containing protein
MWSKIMNLKKNRRILVIDDNEAIHADFRKILASRVENTNLEEAEARLLGMPSPPLPKVVEAFDVESAYQGQEGWEMVRASVAAGDRYAMAFVDMRMPPGWDGVETITKIWEIDPDIQVVICTAYSDYSWEEIIRKLGNVDRLLILKKPFDTIEVCQLACALTQKWHLARHAHLKLNQLRAMVEEQTHSLQAEVAERRKSEDELRQAQGRYALALAGANDGIWDWDFTTQVVFYSGRWKAMLGETDSKIAATADEWFNRIHPDDIDRMKSDLEMHIQGRSEQFHSEYRMMHSDGQYRWMLSRGVAVRDPNGKALRAAGSQTDITDRKLAESQLRHDALHDALTGLANRVLIMDRIGQCLQRSKRTPGQLFAVIFLDLDQFKVINDSLGHAAGDQLLIELAKRLETTLRTGDTVSRGDIDHLARLGGDEFVALLDGIRIPADAIRVADRLQQATANPFNVGGQEVIVAASFGIALSNQNYNKPEEILRDADTALYDAKNNGRGCYRLFDPQMHAWAVQRLLMEGELRRGIERGELRLFYQPVQSLLTGQLVEVEALVRWEHPNRGTILPADFIPLAEETGLILPLGQWVLHEACRQMKLWQTHLPRLRDLSIAVNVSGHQFARAEMPAKVAEVLAATGLLARHLKLEITETTIMESGDPAVGELDTLHDMGLQFHLDDFGTGYSSLGHLHRMPIEALKIDRSFIAALGGDQTGTSIVQAIVALARALGMRVIAEGVETQSQADFLRRLGCDHAQGYYFAQPLTAEQFVQFADGIPGPEKAAA